MTKTDKNACNTCNTSNVQGAGIPVNILLQRMVCVMILVGVALTYWVSEWFHLLLIFVAVNYLQSSFSWGICPPSFVLGKVGWIAVDPEETPLRKPRVYFMGKNMPANSTADDKSEEDTHLEATLKP
jgi:hypothetical protein